MKHALALSIFFLLSACATQYDLLRSYSGADSGTVIASVGMTSGNTMNFATIEFRKKNSTDLGLLEFSPKAAAAFGGALIDFTSSAGSATLVRKQLPPGEYEIIRYSSGSNYGGSMVWYTAPENFSLSFTVRTAETAYLGQYLIGLNLVNGRPSSSYLEITDEFRRDTAKLGVAGARLRNDFAKLVEGTPSGAGRLN